MFVIRILGGRVSKYGKLTPLTVVKLWMALALARMLHDKGVSYTYVFPQGGRRPFHKYRPCDVMSHWILKRDRNAPPVNVPESGVDLLTRQERLGYVEDVTQKHHAGILRKRDIHKVRHLTSDQEEFGADDCYLANVIPIRPEPRL